MCVYRYPPFLKLIIKVKLLFTTLCFHYTFQISFTLNQNLSLLWLFTLLPKSLVLRELNFVYTCLYEVIITFH